MNFKLSTTELSILDIIGNNGGNVRTPDLVTAYQARFKGTPKQTVYRCLSDLRRKEVLVTAKKMTSVNTHWIGNLREKLDTLESYSRVLSIPNRVSYSFPSFQVFTPVLTHHVNILINQSNKSDPVIFINPHQWFFIAREWSEDQLVNKIEEEGHTLWQGITHRSEIDKGILKNKFAGRPTIHGSFVGVKPGEKDLYLAIIGDYVIKTSTTAKFAEAMNALYTKNKTVTPEFVSDLENILEGSGPVKMVITKSRGKADQYRKMMKKFVV